MTAILANNEASKAPSRVPTLNQARALGLLSSHGHLCRPSADPDAVEGFEQWSIPDDPSHTLYGAWVKIPATAPAIRFWLGY